MDIGDNTVQMTFDFDSTLNVMCNFEEIKGIFRELRHFDPLQASSAQKSYPKTMTMAERKNLLEQMKNMKVHQTMLQVLSEESKDE